MSNTHDIIETTTSETVSTRWGLNHILENADVEILILDLDHQPTAPRDPVFYRVLSNNQLCEDYQSLYQILLQDLKLPQQKPYDGSVSGCIIVQEKLLNCSVYHIANRYRLIFVRDITEKERLETIAQAVNSMDNLGFIFSGIRHEIGNPVNSLKMTLSVLKQNISQFSEQTIHEYVDRSIADIGRMEYLLKSLKSFSMFEHVELADVKFGEFIESFLSLAERDLQQRGIPLRIDSSLDLATVRIDPRAMHQVLLNVLANAADALEGRTQPRIRLSAKVRDNIFWLKLSDNGCGISFEQQKYLFQPFNSNKPNGNGLGLVITRKLLTLMNSSIDIQSKFNKGTTVTISLPISQAI